MNIILEKLSEIPKLVKDCLTGPDGQTYDIARVMFAMGAAVFFAAVGNDIWVNHLHFDPMTYAGGFTALTAGSAAASAVKQATGAEPKAPD